MNILFFTHEKAYGGASRALITIIDDLKDKCNIIVVVPSKKAKIISQLKERNIPFLVGFYGWWQVPVNVSFIKKILFRILYLFEFFSIISLCRKIKKLNIDIIHSNTSVIDIGAKISKKLKIPHVWHFREFTGIHLKFIKGEKRSYKFINKNADHIIYISKAIQNFYEEKIDKKLGTLIYDGVPESYITDKEYVYKTKLTFLLVGTLEKNKGQYLAIEAANILCQNGIRNFEVWLVGGDPTGYSSYLNELITKYQLKDCVKYIGFVSDMKKLRKEVDVELMCSPREAFGLVTIEAMMAGNPVIGSDSGATSELIVDGKTGYLYELNNERDLSEKMLKLIKNPEMIKIFGQNAKQRAINNFGNKQNSSSILKLYQEIRRNK